MIAPDASSDLVGLQSLHVAAAVAGAAAATAAAAAAKAAAVTVGAGAAVLRALQRAMDLQ
jgi:hypothetical protein